MEKISVIISGPTSNGNVYNAVQSIFNSTYRNVEVILFDDGTLTGVEALLEEYQDKICYIESNSASPGKCWNDASKKATGEMISFLDGKDVSGKMRLELLVKKILDNPNTGMAFCGMTYINSEGQFLSGVNLLNNFNPKEGFGRLLKGNYIGSISSTLITREAFERSGRFDESLNVNFDYDLYLRILMDSSSQYLNLPLLRYCVMPEINSITEVEKQESELYILNKHDVGVIADNLAKLYDSEDEFRLALGQVLYRMGKTEEALLNFHRVLSMNNENCEAYFLIGNYYYQQGDVDKARNWYTDCLNRNPNHAGSRNNLGVILYLYGARDESLVEFDRAKHLRKNYYDALFNLHCLQKKVTPERLRITGLGESGALLPILEDYNTTNVLSRPSFRNAGT